MPVLDALRTERTRLEQIAEDLRYDWPVGFNNTMCEVRGLERAIAIVERIELVAAKGAA